MMGHTGLKKHVQVILFCGLVSLVFLAYLAFQEDSSSLPRLQGNVALGDRLEPLPLEKLKDKVEHPPLEVFHVNHPLNQEVQAQFGEPRPKEQDAALKADNFSQWVMPTIEGVNVVSMTLYGTQGRYIKGAMRNAQLIKRVFPGWTLRIYTETPSNSRFGAIPTNVVHDLRNEGVEFYFMQPQEGFIPPMMWRFLVADDTWVDRFIVRDADARLTSRDAAMVYEWIQAGAPFMCIRDHPSHAGFAVSGGLWGGRPTSLRDILRRSWRDLMWGVRDSYLEDMNFLNHVIWPKLRNHSYCVDTVSCQHWTGAHPFRMKRRGYEHVGQVYNEFDLGRPDDMTILRNAGENKNCT